MGRGGAVASRLRVLESCKSGGRRWNSRSCCGLQRRSRNDVKGGAAASCQKRAGARGGKGAIGCDCKLPKNSRSEARREVVVSCGGLLEGGRDEGKG